MKPPQSTYLTPIGESGFSLIEVVIALIVLMIGLLGVFSVFTFAIAQNVGNKSRAESLAVLQREAELIRSAKFNSSTTDNRLLGGTSPQRLVIAESGSRFLVDITVDNDPTVPSTQDEDYVCLTPQGATMPCTIKEIHIQVSFAAPTAGWQTAVPAATSVWRVRGN